MLCSPLLKGASISLGLFFHLFELASSLPWCPPSPTFQTSSPIVLGGPVKLCTLHVLLNLVLPSPQPLACHVVAPKCAPVHCGAFILPPVSPQGPLSPFSFGWVFFFSSSTITRKCLFLYFQSGLPDLAVLLTSECLRVSGGVCSGGSQPLHYPRRALHLSTSPWAPVWSGAYT